MKLAKLAAAAIVITLSGLHPSNADDRLAVVATFSILGDFAQKVGGDRIALRTLVGPNGDAHVYEPKPADAIAIAKADVVLVNGLRMEGFLQRLVDASGTSAEIVELTQGATILADPTGGHYHGATFHAAPQDPHAWQSVANAKIYVSNIEKALCAADAAGCPTYQANAAAYQAELTALQQEVRDAIASIPAERRVVVVDHNAFRYFEHEFGLTFLAPQGVSTESEASAGGVGALIREIREKRASAVFGENISDTRLVEQIASEAGLKLGGTLYSDALSPPDGPVPGYVDLIRHNVRTIVTAIGG